MVVHTKIYTEIKHLEALFISKHFECLNLYPHAVLCVSMHILKFSVAIKQIITKITLNIDLSKL